MTQEKTSQTQRTHGQKNDLVLFTTLGCHLCEEALQMLEYLAQQGVVRYRCTEIAESEKLVEEYGVRIPVIQRGDGAELGWPFEFAALEEFATG